jgi:hypothetical protein
MTIAARDFARGYEDRMTSANGTSRTCRDVRLESAFGGRAEVSFQGREDRF